MKPFFALLIVALFVASPSVARAEQISITTTGPSNAHTMVHVELTFVDKGKREWAGGVISAERNSRLSFSRPATMTQVVFTGKSMEGARICQDTQRYATFQAEVTLDMSKCTSLVR